MSEQEGAGASVLFPERAILTATPHSVSSGLIVEAGRAEEKIPCCVDEQIAAEGQGLTCESRRPRKE